jgi:hypothetical protein
MASRVPDRQVMTFQPGRGVRAFAFLAVAVWAYLGGFAHHLDSLQVGCDLKHAGIHIGHEPTPLKRFVHGIVAESGENFARHHDWTHCVSAVQ